MVRPNGGIENILEKFFKINQDIVSKGSDLFAGVNINIVFSNVEFVKPYYLARSKDIKSSSVDR
jgi:hypothetical protein